MLFVDIGIQCNFQPALHDTHQTVHAKMALIWNMIRALLRSQTQGCPGPLLPAKVSNDNDDHTGGRLGDAWEFRWLRQTAGSATAVTAALASSRARANVALDVCSLNDQVNRILAHSVNHQEFYRTRDCLH